ncbi:DUF4177 domain-containing protein [Roseovarius aestuariivivens]|uniref:DUF4177 domain-containing protein n=1 Tax=Roseovarius aestuariivivens TaxID=1888910 RepID=UPI001AEC2F6E|nr:DUF4177 domain-containing protein [Roseovarius aestuariivivens]
MQHYEYKVIPAPAKGRKAPGVKGADARFAHALETAINELAASGWEYLRADILPSEERQGLTSTQTVYRSVLVFRRPIDPGILDRGPVDGDSPEAVAATEVIEDAKSAAEDIDPAVEVPDGEPRSDPSDPDPDWPQPPERDRS